MKLNFEEACSAVADLYEAVPETYISGAFIGGDAGPLFPYSEHDRSAATKWCAIGGVAIAMNADFEKVRHLLRPFSKPRDPADESNESRKSAIALLRRAAGNEGFK